MAWTKEEEEYLINNYSKKIYIDDFCESLNKSRRAIRHKAARLGIGRKGMLIKKLGDVTPRNLIDKKYYLKNKAEIYQRKLHRRWRIKHKLVDMMGGKCSLCGYDKCIAALDFHHTSKEKDFSIYELLKGSSEQNVLKEAKRCILVCANCHREIHHTGP